MTLRMIPGLITIFLLIAGVACTNAEITDLGGGYAYRDTGTVSYIFHSADYLGPLYYERLVPCVVREYSFNENFIIAAQSPDPNCYMDAVRKDVVDTGYEVNYWIVVKDSNQTIGPLSLDEYLLKRHQLQVPDSLKLAVD